MKARTLTWEETKKYMMQPQCKYGLLDTQKDSIMLESDQEKTCVDALQAMTPLHPRYQYMELVQQPENTERGSELFTQPFFPDT